MSDPIISRERIRKAAERAVAEGKLATCPPEFLPYRNIWLAEYQRALAEKSAALEA